MNDTQMCNTGVRLTKRQFAKADRLATSLQVSRNRLIGMLIDSAEVESKPVLSVGLQKNNRQAAQDLTGQSSLAVGA